MEMLTRTRQHVEQDADIDLRMISPLTMAYMGDAIFELYVRDHLVTHHKISVNHLHQKAIAYVKAASQCKIVHELEDFLTEEEKSFVRRGRNQKTTAPKNSDPSEYRYATGFEALLGFLYYQNKTERMLAIMKQGLTILDRNRKGETTYETR